MKKQSWVGPRWSAVRGFFQDMVNTPFKVAVLVLLAGISIVGFGFLNKFGENLVPDPAINKIQAPTTTPATIINNQGGAASENCGGGGGGGVVTMVIPASALPDQVPVTIDENGSSFGYFAYAEGGRGGDCK